jgi:hypothetical protein
MSGNGPFRVAELKWRCKPSSIREAPIGVKELLMLGITRNLKFELAISLGDTRTRPQNFGPRYCSEAIQRAHHSRKRYESV